MKLLLSRVKGQLRRAAHSGQPLAPAQALLPELLLAILLPFWQYQQPIEDFWLPRREQRKPDYELLRTVMLVCRAWYSVAARLYYHAIEIQPADTSEFTQAVKTLEDNPLIARHVRVIHLPRDMRLIGANFNSLPWMKKLNYHRLRSQMKTSVIKILSLCTGATDVRFGADGYVFSDVFQLSVVADRLTHLSLNTYLYSNHDVDELNKSCILELDPYGMKLPALEVLRISHFAKLSVIAPGPGRLRKVFPRLRALIVSNSDLPSERTLADLIISLQPGLQVLALSDVYVTEPPVGDRQLHALDALYAVSHNAIAPLQDLRLRVSSKGLPTRWHWPQEPSGADVLRCLTHLTIHRSMLLNIGRVPFALQTFICYYWEEDREEESLWKALQFYRHAVPRWKECAPALSLIVQRVPNSEVGEFSSWATVSFLLHIHGSRFGVAARTDIWSA